MSNEHSFFSASVSDSLRIYYFSDTHLQARSKDTPYLSDAWLKDPNPCLPLSNEALLASHLDRALEGNADLILCGGDLCHFPSSENKALVTQLFWECPLPILCVPGNHDSFYPGQEGGAELHEKQLPLLHPLFGQNPCFWKHEQKGIRILGLDNSQYVLSQAQSDFLHQELATDQPTLLMMHIPLKTAELSNASMEKFKQPMLMADPEKEFPEGTDLKPTYAVQKLLRNSQQLLALLSAHVHFPFKENISAYTPQLIPEAGYRHGYHWINIAPIPTQGSNDNI